MKSITIKLIIVLITSVTVFSQVSQEWASKFCITSPTGIANSMFNDASGNVYLTGKSRGEGSSYDFLTVKYNSAGAVMWTAKFNGAGNGNGEAISIAVDRNKNVFVTGTSYSGNSNGTDIVTIKYNALGIMQWANSYNSQNCGNEGGISVQVDSLSNVYVKGFSTFTGREVFYTTIKYNSSGAMLLISNSYDLSESKNSSMKNTGAASTGYSGKFELEQNYPNPFSTEVKIKFTIPSTEGDISIPVKLTVLDKSGKNVQTLIDSCLSPGTYTKNVNPNDLFAGNCCYKLETSEFSATRNLLIIEKK